MFLGIIFIHLFSFLNMFLSITAIKITSDVAVDKATGLSATTSKLEYTAVKEDINSKFTCQVQHIQSANVDSSPLVFTVNCKFFLILFTKRVSFQFGPMFYPVVAVTLVKFQ